MKFFCKSIFFGFLGILFSGVLSAGTLGKHVRKKNLPKNVFYDGEQMP